MRIGLNVVNLAPRRSGGMEWYVRCLVRELARIDQDNDYVLVTGAQNHHLFPALPPRWQRILYPREAGAHILYRETPADPPEPAWWYRGLRRAYRRLRGRAVSPCRDLAELIRRERLDVWFCPLMFYLPFQTDVPVVHTIADLQHEHYPQFFDEKQLATRALGYQFSCKAAAATIAISQHVAEDIKRFYGVDPARVFGIPLALDPYMEDVLPRAERLTAQARIKYRLDGDYIYYPANGWPHKNHANLVRAMRWVAREAPGVKLVLSGYANDLLQRIEPLLNEHGLHDLVRYLGYVTRDDVVGLYAGARMLVFPSLFEGFGLPLLEAMHLGTPVACSRVGSLPEVAGDATLFFDPHDDRDIARAIVSILQDDSLRQRLIDAGRAQVARFSYARTAAETLEVFRKVHSGSLPNPKLPVPRPLGRGKVLEDGRCRWFFRHTDLRELHLEAAAPGGGDAAEDRQLTVTLDGERILTASLPGTGSREFVLKAGPASAAAGEFHAIEIVASAAGSAPAGSAAAGSAPPAVRLNRLIALDSRARRTRLVA
jgi:glycosyltransferase involved in cell wall biosynthesis